MLLFLLLPSLAHAADPATVTLAEAMRLAETRSSEAIAADARRHEALAGANVALAGLLPQLNASGTWQHWDSEISLDIPLPDVDGPIVIQDQDTLTAQVSASQVLFAPGMFGREASARAGAEAAEMVSYATRAELGMRAAVTWVGMWAAQETLAATRQSRATVAVHAENARSMFAAGTMTELNVQRAELAVREADRKLIDAQRSYDDLVDLLVVLTGVATPGVLALKDVDAAAADLSARDEASLLAEARERRTDVWAARDALKAARAGRWTVAGEWAPTVTANGVWRASNSAGFGNKTAWYVGGGVTLPILDGGLRFADANRVAAQIEAAEQNLSHAEAVAENSVRSSLRSFMAAKSSAGVAAEQAHIAQRARDLAEASFTSGVATQVELQDAENALLDAKVAWIRVQGMEVLARIQLAMAVGEIDLPGVASAG